MDKLPKLPKERFKITINKDADFKVVSRKLVKGYPIELDFNDKTYYIDPVDWKQLTTDKGTYNPQAPVQINTIVIAWIKGVFAFDRVKDIRQENYLPRYQMATSKSWIGKTKIRGIVHEKM